MGVGCSSRERSNGGREEGSTSAPGRVELPVEIYFPNDSGRLEAERRDISTDRRPDDLARAVVEALLDGPQSESLIRPFPPGSRLGSVYVASDGIAFVDLTVEGIELPLPAGSTEERLIVMSLVGSLTLNVPEVNRVVLLWNGVQPLTLAGHLDLSRPLAADPSLVTR